MASSLLHFCCDNITVTQSCNVYMFTKPPHLPDTLLINYLLCTILYFSLIFIKHDCFFLIYLFH
ncbi:hypothetical protein FQN60_000476 [Etheostoma spectabile]|uniref:Uncharacterized protein n=1 Tax=Etheostoma spectabile TaxID=54343 RepID=A0A5J5D1C7_9PERO|nr:hypothetical protein FQN60_000476 [Etheostoma spectabile]